MGAWSAFDLKLTAGDVLRGGTVKRWEQRQQNLKQAVTAAMRERGEAAKNALRGQARAAGLGTRVANTWRGQVYPQRGVSADAAYVLASRAPHIIAGHATGEVIRGRSGQSLVVPTANAPKRLPRVGKVAAVEAKFGKLVYVPLPRGRTDGASGMLVAPKARRRRGKRGGFAPATAASLRRGDGERAVMFWVVRLVRPPKRLANPQPSIRREAAQIPMTIQQHMQRAEARVGR